MKAISTGSAILILAIVILVGIGIAVYTLYFYTPLGTLSNSGVYVYKAPTYNCDVTNNVLSCNVSGTDAKPPVISYTLTIDTGSYLSAKGVYVYCTNTLNSSSGVISSCALPSSYAWTLDYSSDGSSGLYLSAGQSSNWP